MPNDWTPLAVRAVTEGQESCGELFNNLSRRTVLAGAGAVALVGMAGCSTVADWLVDQAFEDVNIVNDSSKSVTINIEVLSQENDVIMEETVEIDGEESKRYEDVWEETGEYTIFVEIEDGPIADDEITIESIDDSFIVYIEDGSIEFEVVESED